MGAVNGWMTNVFWIFLDALILAAVALIGWLMIRTSVALVAPFRRRHQSPMAATGISGLAHGTHDHPDPQLCSSERETQR